MSDEYPTNEFPPHGAPKPMPGAPGAPGVPGAQPPAASPQPPPFGSVPPQQPPLPPGYGPVGPGGPAGPAGPGGIGGTGGPDDPGAGGFGPGPSGPSGPPAGGPGRSRRLTFILIAAIIVVLGAGIGVAVAVGTDDSGTAQGAPSSTTAGSQGAGGQQGKNGKKNKGKHNVIRGTITAESGTTWTVKTQQGKTVKVTIASDTKFGTQKAAAKQTDFTVGKKVVVAGKPGDSTGSDTVTARRIRELPANAGQKNGKSKSTGTPAPSSSPS